MYASASLSPKEQQQKFKLTLSCACQPIMTRQQCVDSHVEQRYGSTKNNLEDYITCPVHNQVVKVLGHTPHFDSNWMGNVAGRLRSARLQKAAAVEEHNHNNE